MGLIDSLKGLFSKGKSAADVNDDGQVNAVDAQAAADSLNKATGGVADVNKDGQLNTADIQAAGQQVAGVADVNNDGQVNTADAQAAAEQVKSQIPGQQ